MKIDFSQKFKNLEGNDMLKVTGDPKSGTATLKFVVPQVLLGRYAGEEALSAEEKHRRYKLAISIMDSVEDTIEINIEDIAYIKKLAGIACDTLTYGRLCDMLPK